MGKHSNTHGCKQEKSLKAQHASQKSKKKLKLRDHHSVGENGKQWKSIVITESFLSNNPYYIISKQI